MTVITMWSESGGVGKTTTTLNLGSALSRQGQNVLLIDMDPQPGSLTTYAGYKQAREIDDDGRNLNEILLHNPENLNNTIIEGDEWDIIPAHKDLEGFERDIRGNNIRGAEFLLQNAMRKLDEEYDIIIIDPPATISLLVDNALIASDDVLIPMEMNKKGEVSIKGVLDTVNKLSDNLKKAFPEFTLDVMGIVPNRVETDSTVNRQTRSVLNDEDSTLIPIEIPEYTVIEKSWASEQSLFKYTEDPKNRTRKTHKKIMKSYNELAKFVAGEDWEEHLITKEATA